MTNKQLKNKLRQALIESTKIDPIGETLIRKKVKQLIEDYNPKIIGTYWPIRNEFNVLPVVEEWRRKKSDHIACLPVIAKKNLCLKFYPWELEMKMEKGLFNIPVPFKYREKETQIPDLLLIPCVGFDSDGFRLGYGGGYYDRTIYELKNNQKKNIITVGISSKSSRIINLPREIHDQALDHIITDE